MKIEYNHIHAGNPDGEKISLEMLDFMEKLPSYGLMIKKTKIFPSRAIINQILSSGKDDAGMSGMFEWEPQSITEDDYHSFQREVLRKYGDVVVFVELDTSMKGWVHLMVKSTQRR